MNSRARLDLQILREFRIVRSIPVYYSRLRGFGLNSWGLLCLLRAIGALCAGNFFNVLRTSSRDWGNIELFAGNVLTRVVLGIRALLYVRHTYGEEQERVGIAISTGLKYKVQ